MEATNNPGYLRQLVENVGAFRASFVELMELYVENTGFGALGRGMAPAVFEKEGADPKRRAELRSEVSQAAGRAMVAAQMTNTLFVIQGVGMPINPIENWDTIMQPRPLLEPENILSSTDRIIGKLETMIAKAEAEAPAPIGVRAFHPLVWGAARRLWNDGHYRQAVQTAAEAVMDNVKSLTGRRELADTGLWQEVFSNKPPEPAKPRLRWPGNPTDRDVMAMNDGLRQFAPGVQMTIRNGAVHGVGEMTEQDAIERLATLSLLARFVDQCDLKSATT